MSSPFKTIALIGKHENPEIVKPLLRLGQYLQNRSLEVLLDCLTASQGRDTVLQPLARR